MSTTNYPASDDEQLSSGRISRPLSNGSSPSEAASNDRHEPRPDNELFDRVVQGAHQAIDRLADSATPHVQRLQQGMASASDALQERADQARDMGDEWAASLRTTVRDNPLTAVAAALVAGVLIARLTRR
jgi:ElaB/YqjD/DUF883 family membrane-anchored ribosome-binding protein